MPIATTAPPATVAKALDAVADAVLAMATASPRPTRQKLAVSVQRRFGIEVTPDNLRVWIARRQADAVRAAVEPAARHVLDDHIEFVNELRDPSRNDGRAYLWTQVLDALIEIDPALAAYTPEGLRSWHSRFTRRAEKARAAATWAPADRDNSAGADQERTSPTPGTEPITANVTVVPSVHTAVVTELAPDPARAVATGQDAQRAEATDELARLRGQGESELGGLLGKFLTPQASK